MGILSTALSLLPLLAGASQGGRQANPAPTAMVKQLYTLEQVALAEKGRCLEDPKALEAIVPDGVAVRVRCQGGGRFAVQACDSAACRYIDERGDVGTSPHAGAGFDPSLRGRRKR